MKEKMLTEDLIIRKSYLDKTSGKNFDAEFRQFAKNIKITSDMMYFKFQAAFSRSGFTQDDVLSMSNLYSYYYFDLYMSKTSPDEKSQRNGLIGFLRQRMHYLAHICEREAVNHNVGRQMEGFFAKTANSMEVDDREIFYNPVDFGYRKVTAEELAEIKDRKQKIWRDRDGFEVFKVSFYEKISSEEYADILHEGIFENQSVDEEIIDFQDKLKLEARMVEFNNKSVVDKIEFLKKLTKETQDPSKKNSAQELLKIIKKQAKNARDTEQLQSSDL